MSRRKTPTIELELTDTDGNSARHATPHRAGEKQEGLANMTKKSRDSALKKLESIHERMKDVTEAEVDEALAESESITIAVTIDTFEYDAFGVSTSGADRRHEPALTQTA